MEPYLKPGQDGYTGDNKPKQKSLDDNDDDDDDLKKPAPAVQASDESEEEAAAAWNGVLFGVSRASKRNGFILHSMSVSVYTYFIFLP